MRGLLEIFHFYARQHIPLNKQFDDLKEIMNQMDLGEFTVFCKDFSIPLTKQKEVEVFKKCSMNHMPLKFEHFQNCLLKLAQEITRGKVDSLSKRLKDVVRAIQKKERELKKDHKERMRLEEEQAVLKQEELARQLEEAKNDEKDQAEKDLAEKDQLEKQEEKEGEQELKQDGADGDDSFQRNNPITVDDQVNLMTEEEKKDEFK